MSAKQVVYGGLETLEVTQGTIGANSLVFIALHGRGASADDLVPFMTQLVPGTGNVIGLFPNAPMVLRMGGWGYGYAWYDLGPDQHRTLRESREQLTELVQDVITTYGVAPSRILLGGFSQGAAMTFETGLRFPEPLAGLIALSGYMPEPEILLPEVAPVRSTPIFIGHGTADEVVPVEASRLAHRELVKLGYAVDFQEFPMGHHIIPAEIAVIRQWIQSNIE